MGNGWGAGGEWVGLAGTHFLFLFLSLFLIKSPQIYASVPPIIQSTTISQIKIKKHKLFIKFNNSL
jgi:hypothetical protein